MNAPIKILILVLALSLPHVVQGQSSAMTFQKLQRSKDPDMLRRSIEEFSLKANDKSQFRDYILFQMVLGDLYERSGDYVLAEKRLKEAYDEAKKYLPTIGRGEFRLAHFAKFQKTIFDPIDQLAYFYLKIGNLRSAEHYFKESKTRRDNFFPSRSIHRVQPIVGMGSWYFRKGDFEKTYELFEQATKLIGRATTTGYNFDNLTRLYLADLIEICLTLNKGDEALGYINQLAVTSSGAKKFSSEIVSKLEVARVLELKARYFLLERDYKKAREYLDKADYYNPKVAVSDVKFKLIRTRGLLEWYEDHSEQATAAFENLVTEYRDHIARNFSAMTEYEKEKFYLSLKNDFDLYNAFVVDQDGVGAQGLREEMYNNVLNTKALLLNETNRQKNRILAQGDAVVIAQLHDWEDSKARLSAQYYEKIDQTKVDSLEKHINALEKELGNASGLFGEKEAALTWQQVRDKLGAGEAAAEVVRVRLAKKGSLTLTDSVVYAVLLVTHKADAPKLFVLSNGNLMEHHFLRNYRNSILFRVEDKLSYNQYWLPIKEQLSNTKTLYFSPDGVYNQISLNTLLNTTTQHYLIDEINLTNLTNTSDLLAERNQTIGESVVLVGRPSYDLEIPFIAGQGGRMDYGNRNLISEELQSFKEQEFEDLPGTEAEISTIEPILKKLNLSVVTYTGKNALEENVKIVRHPAILHIATHGFFVDDTASLVSPMIRSGLILAGVSNSRQNQRGDDGILTAYETTNVDLEGTSLVVLSACQTGLGEVRNGEGVYGLQRAIMVAGAQNLLMSLWKVDDVATAELMTSFYRQWTGKNNTNDFRKAQISLRLKYPQPFYWGAFVMLGK